MIFICADHRGFELKEYLKKHFDFVDLTPEFHKGDDYPDIAKKLVKKIAGKSFGILVCGSGTGVAMSANRNKHIRAVNAYDLDHAIMSRKHENANVLCLGSNYLSKQKAKRIIEAFLKTRFSGGRHLRRIKKL